MNSKLIFTIAFLLISTSLSAQIQLSFQAGANYSSTQFKNLDSFQFEGEPRWGYYLSVTPGVELTDRLSVHAELQYSLEGYESTSPVGGEIKYDFVRILPQLEVNITNNLSALVGANVGYKLNEIYKEQGGTWLKLEEDLILNDWDLGAVAGLKYYLGNIFVSARYHFGLSNMTNVEVTDATGTVIGDLEQHNRNLQIGLGIRLR